MPRPAIMAGRDIMADRGIMLRAIISNLDRDLWHRMPINRAGGQGGTSGADTTGMTITTKGFRTGAGRRLRMVSVLPQW